MVTCSLLGCLGAACASREALFLYTFLLLPCLVAAALVTGFSVAGADAAVATLAELGHGEQVARAAIGNGATPYAAPALSSGAREEALRALFSGWQGLYDDCAPAVDVACEGGSGEGGSGEGGSGAPTNSAGCGSRAITAADYAVIDSGAFGCSSNATRDAEFGTWASDKCLQLPDELAVANCSMVVAALTNTSDTGSEGGALWLFCACATAIADEVPERTAGVEAAMLAMCVLLALLLLVDALTIREVTARDDPCAHPYPSPLPVILTCNANANASSEQLTKDAK